MLEPMYWACSEALTLAVQLGSAQDLPPPEVLRQRVRTLFDQMALRAQQLHIPPADIQEAQYAIVAFIDEQVLRTQWPGRQQWMSQPLQLVYFNENTAGEGFFVRMQALEGDPQRSHVLEIYYLCIALGFQGRYAIQGASMLDSVTDQLATRLSARLPDSDLLSAHGSPRGASVRGASGRGPLVMVALGVLAAVVALFIVFKIVVGVSASNAVDDMRRPGGPTSSLPSATLNRVRV